jgi:hypothetical protein
MRTPISSSSAARIGRSWSPSTLVRIVVPIRAPSPPGIAKRSTSRRSTLPKCQWEAPLTIPVATLARLTVADTAAGLRPDESKMLDDVGPNPIPSAPSTNDAANPAIATIRMSFIPD